MEKPKPLTSWNEKLLRYFNQKTLKSHQLRDSIKVIVGSDDGSFIYEM